MRAACARQVRIGWQGFVRRALQESTSRDQSQTDALIVVLGKHLMLLGRQHRLHVSHVM